MLHLFLFFKKYLQSLILKIWWCVKLSLKSWISKIVHHLLFPSFHRTECKFFFKKLVVWEEVWVEVWMVGAVVAVVWDMVGGG